VQIWAQQSPQKNDSIFDKFCQENRPCDKNGLYRNLTIKRKWLICRETCENKSKREKNGEKARGGGEDLKRTEMAENGGCEPTRKVIKLY